MDRMRVLTLGACSTVVLTTARGALGQQSPLPELLPRATEVTLALSAAPAHLRARAGVYVLERNGFVKVRDSKNGFTCVVNRDGPRNQKPTCYDAEGTTTILPQVLFVGARLMKGASLSEIDAEVREGFRTGRFQSPKRPGVAYMLSCSNRDFNPQSGTVDGFPPHVMFYAPNLTNDDIGSDGKFAPGLPSIGYQGPHGFMIVVSPDQNSNHACDAAAGANGSRAGVWCSFPRTGGNHDEASYVRPRRLRRRVARVAERRVGRRAGAIRGDHG